MGNSTPKKVKFNNVILQLSQEMHYHVHRSRNPNLYSRGDNSDVNLANISKESEELASEYANAISLLSSVQDAVEKDADQLNHEDNILIDLEIKNNNSKTE
jgi:hypothetical protein